MDIQSLVRNGINTEIRELNMSLVTSILQVLIVMIL